MGFIFAWDNFREEDKGTKMLNKNPHAKISTFTVIVMTDNNQNINTDEVRGLVDQVIPIDYLQ